MAPSNTYLMPLVHGQTDHYKRPVQCIETGVKYKSIKQASEMTGISTYTLRNHLNEKEGCKKAKGFTFKYL